MLTLFLTVSYSANIVSLLQTTSSAINSIRDLIDSPFKLGMMDIIHNINYVNVSQFEVAILMILVCFFVRERFYDGALLDWSM